MKTDRSNLYCPYMHGCGNMYKNMGKVPVDKRLKKEHPTSPSSHFLKISLQIDLGPEKDPPSVLQFWGLDSVHMLCK